jgi:hypothetical protein
MNRRQSRLIMTVALVGTVVLIGVFTFLGMH